MNQEILKQSPQELAGLSEDADKTDVAFRYWEIDSVFKRLKKAREILKEDLLDTMETGEKIHLPNGSYVRCDRYYQQRFNVNKAKELGHLTDEQYEESKKRSKTERIMVG